MAYTYIVIFSYKNTAVLITYYIHIYDMNKPFKHYAKWGQSVTKDTYCIIVWFNLYEISRLDKAKESSLMVAWKWGAGKGMGFVLWVMKMSKIRLQWWLHNSVDLLETIELYTSKEWIVWHMNYIPIFVSIFSLKKKKTKDSAISDSNPGI